MQLYLVERNKDTTKWDYDQYDSFVVWANSEEEARYTSPCGNEYHTWHDGSWYFKYSDGTESIEKEYHGWPDDPKTLKVWELSRPPEKPTVVLASYNAG
jgi:hypothetical protein